MQPRRKIIPTRFFQEQQPELTLAWNKARASDWAEIERIFVAAYMNAYCFCEMNDLGISHDIEEIARNKLKSVRDNKLGLYDDKRLEEEILSPLQRYFTHSKAPREIVHHLIFRSARASAQFESVIIKLLMLDIYFSKEFAKERQNIIDHSASGVDKVHYLTAYYHERPVAFYVSQMNYKSGHVYMRWATIAPGFQQEGLGEKMYNEVARHFPEATGIDLYTRTVNTGAMRFYQKNDFCMSEHLNFTEPANKSDIPKYVRRFLKGKQFFLPADDGTDTPELCVGFMKLLRGRF